MWRCVALSGLHRGGGKRILQSRSTFPGADTAHTGPATATEAAAVATASTGTIRATPG